MQALLPPVIQLWALPLLAPLVSVAYYWASPAAQPFLLRLLASAHGAVLAVVYAIVIALTVAHGANPAYVTPFLAALGVPVVLMVTSFFVFRGRRVVHVLQLLNVVCVLLASLFGAMAITGEGL
jgi:predicted signal transduction protein with EAL and GGDEF domain